MQTLDTLGAGFQLASHDLDIRGAGNLLGEEQSGHIREVGIELYQQMLEEAVAAARGAGAARPRRADWSPQIKLGIAGADPRGLRRRPRRCAWGSTAASARSPTRREIDAFAAELIDRFGKLPPEVENLLQDHRDQAAVPRGRRREDRRRREGAWCCRFHDNKFAQARAADRLDPEERAAGEAAGPTTA